MSIHKANWDRVNGRFNCGADLSLRLYSAGLISRHYCQACKRWVDLAEVDSNPGQEAPLDGPPVEIDGA